MIFISQKYNCEKGIFIDTFFRFCLITLKLRVSIILIQKVLCENQETSKNVLMSISKTILFLMNLER